MTTELRLVSEDETLATTPALHEVHTLDEYLRGFGKILGKKAIHALEPLHIPNHPDHPLEDFSDVVDFNPDREPFPRPGRGHHRVGEDAQRGGKRLHLRRDGNGQTSSP